MGPTFSRGGDVVEAVDGVLANPARLRDWIVGRRITHAAVDAATAERLFELYWPAGTALRELVVRGKRVVVPPPGLPFDVVAELPQDHEPFGLTDTQQAYWVGRGDAVELGGVGCHGYWEWDSDDLEVERFRLAWRKVLDRHPMLRAVVSPDGTQRVLADAPEHPIPVLDLRGATEAQAQQVAGQLRDELSHQVLPADRYPLWDVRLTLLPGGRARIHLGLDLLIIDAWSYFQVLMPDLISYYTDPDAELEPIGLTFREYVQATEVGSGPASVDSAQHARARDYWLERLDSLPPAPDLPRVARRPAATPSFTRRERRLPAGSWSALKARAGAGGVTPAGLVVAAFAEVLRTWSASDTFTINFPLFNRQPVHRDVDRLVGDFTTTSLLAVDKVDGTFAERARSIQRRLWADLEHRQFSGVRVGRELARRAGGVRASFPVVVTSLLGQPPRHFTTALGRNVFTSTQTPQVSLDFQVMEVEGELRYSWDSVDELFCPGLVADMFEAYRRLLDQLAADPQAWHTTQFQLVPHEQLQVRARVNATDGPVPGELLHEPLARHAGRTPAAEAVVDGGLRLTYAELSARVNRLARRLRDLGARPNTLVAIVLDKGWQQIVAAHGVLAAGAAYLPIDPCVPAARLRYLLADGQVETVLTSADVDSRLDWPGDVHRIRVDDPHWSGWSDEPLAPVQRPTDLAYVIYTSGSTGRPKGVMVDHRGAVNTIADVNRRFGIGAADSCLAVTALHHDLSVYDVFGMTAAGGKVVVAPGQPDPARWAELITTERVTFWNSVPALLELLVDGGHRLDPLRLVILAGDWIPVTLPDRLRALGSPGLCVIASGGPTESCVWSIINEVGAVDPAWASIPYGRPMTNQRYHVLDGRRLPRPVWVPGELHIESDVGLARGYWGDPERTAAKFYVEAGRRRYASGDLGRYLPDGTIEILGRDDFQVKIAGQRIELGEIEATLAEHACVDRAVVVATGAPRSLRQLQGFVTVCAEVAADELRRFAADRLPAHLVPATVTVVDSFPLTPNGKLDRAALAAASTAPAGPSSRREPTEPLDQVLAALWTDLLDTGPVGLDENFFALGGNSITATRLVARIRELFDVDIGLRTVFDAPTVAEQSAALATPAAVALAETLTCLTPDDIDRLAAPQAGTGPETGPDPPAMPVTPGTRVC